MISDTRRVFQLHAGPLARRGDLRDDSMHRLFHIFKFLFCALFGTMTAAGQISSVTDGSLSDVFPLSVGNQWLYRYFVDAYSYPSGNPFSEEVDTGLVRYTVVGRITSIDSTRWQLQVVSLIWHYHRQWNWSEGAWKDSSFSISDTSITELIERHAGQHQLYRRVDPYAVRREVFSFTAEYVDTIPVYRYQAVGLADTVAIKSWIPGYPNPYLRSVLTFKKGTGLIRNSYNSGTVDGGTRCEHVLIASTITQVRSQEDQQVPSSLLLFQNYPNPFNARTNISFHLQGMGWATVIVYDALGRERARLFDGLAQWGLTTISWNTDQAPSGVYFCRLVSGSVTTARSMLLLK